MLMPDKENPIQRMQVKTSDRAYPALAAKAVQRLWEDLVVQQAEEIPFRTRFRFKVPEHPSVSLLFENADLSCNVELRVRFELLAPCIDEVDVVARANSSTLWVPPIVSCTDVPAVKPSRAIGHGSRPLAHDRPVVSSLVGG